jgi:hypothetical protein
MRCGSCGNDNPAGAVFCNRCAASLSTEPPAVVSPESVSGDRYSLKHLLGEGATP